MCEHGHVHLLLFCRQKTECALNVLTILEGMDGAQLVEKSRRHFECSVTGGFDPIFRQKSHDGVGGEDHSPGYNIVDMQHVFTTTRSDFEMSQHRIGFKATWWQFGKSFLSLMIYGLQNSFNVF